MKIFLDTEIIKKLSPQGLAVNCALKSIPTDAIDPFIYTNMDYLVFTLTSSINYSSSFKGAIISGFQELIDGGYIKIVNKKKESYILDISGLFVDLSQSFCTVITSQEVREIFGMKDTRLFPLLQYFVYLVSTMTIPLGTSQSCFVGNMAASYLGNMIGATPRTVYNYNSKLEEAHLIYVCRKHIFSSTEEGDTYKTPNIYGRYEDRGLIESQALTFLRNKKYSNISSFEEGS